MLAIALAACASASPAQLITWTGAGANTSWSTGQNWSTGAQPVNSGTLVFSGTTRTTSSNDITNGTFGGLNFTNTGVTGSNSSFTLSGNAFTLAGGGSIVTTATTAGSALTDTLAMNIVLGTNATVTTNAGHNLTISGTISGSGFGLTKTGGNTLTLSGSNTFDGPVSIQGGTVIVNSINNAGVAGGLGTTGTITINTTTSLDYRGEAASTDRSFIIGSGGAIGAGFLYNGTAGGGLTFTSGTFNLPTAASSNRNITIYGSSTGTSVIQGVIQDNSGAGGTIGLTKAVGDHTWRLSGANTFSGAVTVQGQTLQIDSWSALGTGTSAVIMGHLNNSAQLEYLGASGTTSRQIQIGNGTLAAHSPVVTLLSNGSGPVVFTSGTFNFAQTNAINTNARRLELSGANTGVNEIQGAIVNNAANAVTTGSGAVALLKTGAGRWVLSGSNTYSGTTTVGAGTLQIGNNGTTGSLSTASVITGSAGATLAFNRTDTITQGSGFSAIGGAINVRQIGSGTLAFNAAQTYSGTTTIDAGTLQITGGGNTDNGALASPSVVVNSGAALQLSTQAALGWKAGRGALTIVGGTVSTDAGLRTSLANNVTMTGGVLTSAGAGDSFGNYNLLDAGIVATSDASGNPAAISAQKLALQFTTGSSSTFTFNVTRGSASPASDLTVSAIIANFGNAAGIRKTGNGILSLSAANTYTGTTTIDAGTLRITYGGNVANGALASPSVVVNSGATLQLSAQRAIGYTAGRAAVTIAGGTVTTDAGWRTAFVNNVTMTGGVLTSAGAGDSNGNYNFYDAGVVATSDAAGNAATISAEKLSLQFSSGSGTTTFNVTRGSASPASDLTISAVLANFGSGTAGIRKIGNGILTLSAANTYTGQTRVSDGMLALGAADAIFNQSSLLVDGGGFNLAGYNDTVGSVTITSGSIYGNGTLTAATYSLGGGRVAANLGAGTLAVTANSSLDGSSAATAVDLNAGTLTLGSGGRFTAVSVAVSGSSGASLTLGGNEAFGSLAGAANIALGGHTLSVGAANTATTYSGVLSGVGGLTKVGSGVFTLANANTYSGNTVISGSGSVLKLGAAGSFANSPVIMVGDAASMGAILDLTAKSGTFALADGQTLKGGGTIQLGADGVLDVQGTFAPGNSPGLFTYDGGTTLLSGTTIMEIFGTNRATLASHGADPFYDAVDVINGGTLTLGGLLTLDITGTYANNTTFNLFSASAGSSLSGNFANIVFSDSSSYAGLTFTSGTANPKVWTSTATTAGQSFTFDAAVGTLVIVPEPGTAIFAGIGIAMAGWSLWKRRRCGHILRR